MENTVITILKNGKTKVDGGMEEWIGEPEAEQKK